MQSKWAEVLRTEENTPWLRARLMLVGEGRAGKTCFVRALQNKKFEDTASTVGIETTHVETTDVLNWQKMHGNPLDQVRQLI